MKRIGAITLLGVALLFMSVTLADDCGPDFRGIANRFPSRPVVLPQSISSEIADYLKVATHLRFAGRLGVITHKDENAPRPPQLQKYFDQLIAEIANVDPEAKIVRAEIIHVAKGAARTPYTHFDAEP